MADLPAVLGAITAMLVVVTGFVIAYRKIDAARDAAKEVRADALEAKDQAAAAALAAAAAQAAAEESKAELILTHGDVVEVGKRIDGRLTKLLELTEAAALARGRLEGAAEEKVAGDERAEALAEQHRQTQAGYDS